MEPETTTIILSLFLLEFIVFAICLRAFFAAGVNFSHTVEVTCAHALSEFDIPRPCNYVTNRRETQ